MEHFFELPVKHNGQALLLKGRLATFAYVYKFYIVVNGSELVFERDDNGEFRVIAETDNKSEKIEPALYSSNYRSTTAHTICINKPLINDVKYNKGFVITCYRL